MSTFYEIFLLIHSTIRFVSEVEKDLVGGKGCTSVGMEKGEDDEGERDSMMKNGKDAGRMGRSTFGQT